MSPSPDRPTPDHELLLAHHEWLRELARGLVADPNVADDLSQEAWLVALRSPAPRPGSARGWLVALVSNLARKLKRSEARRREHEAGAAEMRAERLEKLKHVDFEHRRLVDRLIELPELYRDVLILRYWEGLTPHEIAARTHEPIATVKTRLRRGLERLRARYRAERGLASLAVLAAPRPFERWGSPAASPAAGSWLWLSAVAAILVLVVVVIEPRAPVVRMPSLERDAADAAVSAHELARADVTTVRVAAERGGVDEVVAAPALRRVRGRVLDRRGRGASGVDVRAWIREFDAELPTDHVGTSRSEGDFELSVPPGDVVLRAEDPYRTALVHAAVTGSEPQHGVVLVVTRKLAVSGRVVDEAGRSVARAQVTLKSSYAPRLNLDVVMDRSFDASWQTMSDAEGRFELPNAPDDPLAGLQVARVGSHVSRTNLAYGPDDLEIVLHPLRYSPTLILGEVVDTDGQPVVAWITLGSRTVGTDGVGRFQISCRPDPETTLVVAAVGYLPTQVDSAEPTEVRGGLPWYRVELEGAPRVAEGIVVDTSGRPVEGARIVRRSGTPFGRLTRNRPGETSEDWLAEDLIVSPDRAGRTTTDAVGHFALDGLLPGVAYELLAFDPTTLACAHGSVVAGELASLRLDGPRLVPVAGRVVDEAGRPLRGVEVAPGIVRRDLDGCGRKPVYHGATVTTDEAGRFRFGALAATRDVALRLSHGPERIPLDTLLELDDDLENLEFVLESAAHFRVELSGEWSAADRFAFVDEAGRERRITYRSGLHHRSFADLSLTSNRPRPLYSVGVGARSLLLFAGGEEIGRLDVHLTPGAVTVLNL